MKVKIKTPGIPPSQDVEIDVRDSTVICMEGECVPILKVLNRALLEAEIESLVHLKNGLENSVNEFIGVTVAREGNIQKLQEYKKHLHNKTDNQASLADLARLVGRGTTEKIIKDVEFLSCPSVTPFPIVLTSDDPEDCLP